jgi:hypothetical protein
LPIKGHRTLLSHYAYPNLTGSAVEFDPIKNDSIGRHFEFMRQQRCDIGIFAHDLQGGVRFFKGKEIEEHPFGSYQISEFPVTLNGPWIANGTEPNGFIIFDTDTLQIEVVPLDTPPVKA